jgi:hypothetical protein
MKSPEWRQHDFVCLRWENDVWIDCEATARLMKSIAFWVHLGFPGSATYTKSSTEELDSTTFWLRELVQHSNSSHPSAVAGAGCKKIHELQARNAAVVPAVVFRSSFAAHFTSTRCRAQSTRYKATRKPKVGRNSQSVSVQFRLSREMTMQQISISFSLATNITVCGLAIQGLGIGKRPSHVQQPTSLATQRVE